MQQRQLNPYAPTTIETARTVSNANDFPESGIQFHGNLDVNEVRKVDRVSLTIGLAIGLAFAGMLAVGAVSALSGGRIAGSRSAAVLMMAATAVTLLAVGGFAYSQADKPIRKFPWMSGPIRGVVHPWRIDVKVCLQ
jgi:hypothetical protein